MEALGSAPKRLRAKFDKLSWGLRQVGPMATAIGTLRLLGVVLARPLRGSITLRSGPVLEFDYPHQLPSTLVLFGDFIDPEFAFLSRIARPCWHVVDVGAAIGQFSVFAAICLPSPVIHAFEPSSANMVSLKRNVERNGVEHRVFRHQVALSNRQEIARFHTAPKNWMSGLGERGELVAVTTLQASLEELGLDHVEILKINVAGFEPAVIEGAMPWLALGRVDILILLLGLASLQLYASMAALDYRFFYYHPNEQTLFEVVQFDADSVLAHRPWPARHIIAIRNQALDRLLAGRVKVRPLAPRKAKS